MKWEIFWICFALVIVGLLFALWGRAAGMAGRAVGLVSPALAGAFAFVKRWRWALMAIPLLAGALWGVAENWKQQGRLEERVKAERVNTAVAEHETALARKASELAENTHQDRERVRVVIARAEEELEDAVSQQDFDALWAAYDRAYERVWNSEPAADRPDPFERRAPVVPGADARSA